MKILLILTLLLVFCVSNSKADDPEKTYLIVNYINHPSPGNMFFGDGEVSCSVFNNYGSLIDSAKVRALPPGLDLRIQSNGVMTYCATRINKFYSLDSNFKIIDTFYVKNGYDTDIHEFIMNKDGSYYLIGSEFVPMDLSSVFVNGKSNAKVNNQILQKYNSQKQLIWSWSVMDHIPVTDVVDMPEEIDMTQVTVDPYHINSLDVDTDGNLLVSIRNLNEIIKLNPTNSQIIWRMGGQKSKHNEFTFINDVIDGFTGFSNTHDARWLKNGNLLLFDNGNTRGGSDKQFSRAVEYKVNQTTKTVEKVWEFIPQPKIYAPIMCGAQRLDNGNTFVTFGNFVFEADKFGNKVFDATKTGGLIYRGYKYNFNLFSLQKDILTAGSYDFNETANPTKAKINLQFIDNAGYMNITRHPYKPNRYNFNDLEPSKIINQRWVVESNFNFTGKLTLELKSFSDYDKNDSLVAYIHDDEDKGNFVKVNSSYNKDLGTLTLDIAKDCEIIVATNDNIANSTLKMLSPRDGDLIPKSGNIFKWYAVTSAQFYELQISEKSDFSTLLVNEQSLTSTSFSTPDFTNGKLYYFRARAKIGTVTSKWSDVWSIKIMLQSPATILPINNAKQILISDKLVWSKIQGATTYDVQISKDNQFTNIAFEKTDSPDTTITFDKLENKNTYYWRVRAGNVDGKSLWSTLQNFKTELNIPNIKYPTNYANSVETNLTLLFDKFSGMDYYQAIIANDSLFTTPQYQLLSAKQDAKLNLMSNTKYYIKLRAIGNSDTSRWSGVVSFTTSLPKPNLVYPLKNDLIFAKNINFAIETMKDVNSFEVNIVSGRIDDNTNKLLDTTFVTNSNTFLVDYLQFKTKNIWKAKAINTFGKSDWTTANEFIIGEQNSLTTPMLNLPENNSNSQGVNGNLVWTNSSNQDIKYRVMLSENNIFNTTLIDEIVNTPNIYYSNLDYNSKYYWRVAATDNGNFSNWSSPWSFTTKTTDLIVPPNLILPLNNNKKISNVSVLFIWEKLAFAVAYNLQVSTTNDFIFNTINETNLPSYLLEVKDLKPLTKYYWRVQAKAKDSTNYGNWSEIHSFDTDLESSIDEENLDLLTNLDFNDNYNIIDLVGRNIQLQKALYTNIEDLKNELRKGVYFIIPKSNEKKLKVIKLINDK